MIDTKVLAEATPRFRVQPKDIRLMYGGIRPNLGKAEIDASFGRLVQFFQERKNCWEWFTLTELSEYYVSQGWDPNTMLFGLTGLWLLDGFPDRWVFEGPFIAFYPEGKCAVTEAFVLKCEWDRRKPDA